MGIATAAIEQRSGNHATRHPLPPLTKAGKCGARPVSWTVRLIVLLALLPGCTSARSWTGRILPAPSHVATSTPSHVIVVRGTAGIRRGCDELVETHKQQGAQATVIR